MIRYISMLAGMLLLCSCTTKTHVILLPDADGKTGAVTVENEMSSVVLDKPYASTKVSDVDAELDTVMVGKRRVEENYKPLFQAEPLKPISMLLYFKFDSDQLNSASVTLIPEIIRLAKEREPSEISIIGHTDTIGTEDFNIKLGLKRAQLVAEMIKKAGVLLKNLTVTSNGENDPLIRTKDNTSEERNRRVEVMIR